MGRLALVEHLLAQDAPFAAARLLRSIPAAAGASPGNDAKRLEELRLRIDEALREADEDLSGKDEELYAIPPEAIHLVSDGPTALEFSRLLQSAAELGEPVGVDAEWRPDGSSTGADSGGGAHPPALLQVACWKRQAASASPQTPEVWLIDLILLSKPGVPESAINVLRSSLRSLLSSAAVPVLGFGFQHDLEKLALLPSWEDCFAEARNVIDLRDACCKASISSQGTGGGGVSFSLVSQLRRWTGRSLDKSMQCSDWARRPLSPAQVNYAAADAACLLLLHEAVLSRRPEAISSSDFEPRGVLRRQGAGEPHIAHQKESSPNTDSDASSTPEHHRALAACRSAVAMAAAALMAEAGAAGCQRARTGSCRLVRAWEAKEESVDRLELNALCFIVEALRNSKRPKKMLVASKGESVLVLTPAGENLDLRWLGNCLGVARRRVRFATPEECASVFGAFPGVVPPVRLKEGVRVLASASLQATANRDVASLRAVCPFAVASIRPAP